VFCKFIAINNDCSHFVYIVTEDKKPREFEIDLSVEEQLGDLIVCPFIHEEVGRKWVNGVAFVKPCVSVNEIQEDINSAQITDSKTIEFALPRTNRVFSNKAAAWKATMLKNAKVQKTKKLTDTLSTFAGETKNKKTVCYKISNDDDVEISNEHFTARGSGERLVDSVMVPCDCETTVGTDTFKHFESLLIWRVCSVDSERNKGDSSAKASGKSKMDELVELMAGNSIA